MSPPPCSRRSHPTILRRRSEGRSVVPALGHPLEKVTRLAAQHVAHGLESAEADRLGTTVLQHCNIGWCDPDSLGELTHRHLSLGQLDVYPDDDWHQMTASISLRNIVACTSRVRITNMRSAIDIPARIPTMSSSIQMGGPLTVKDW